MFDKIKELIEQEVRPALQSHGGDIELIKVENNKVYVKLQGACHGCPGARATLKHGVEEAIKQKYPEIEEVVDITT